MSEAAQLPGVITEAWARPRRTIIRSIDGLRGLASLGIVLFHMSAEFAYSPELFPAAGWFYKYYIFLDLFFVVSGYGIASGYERQFARGVTAASYRTFLWTRFVRIYPLYLFVLLALVGQDLFFLWTKSTGWFDPGYQPFERESANWSNLVLSLLMVQSWGFSYKLVWNIPAWYVSALICAYLVFPFIAAAAARLDRARRAVVLIVAGGGGAAALHIAFRYGYFSHPNDMSPLRAICEFSLGYGVALLPATPRWRSWLQLPLLALVFVALQNGWHDELTLGLLTVFFWSLLDDRGIVAAVFAASPLVWLGGVSMGIFLVHQPILGLFDTIGKTEFASHVWIFWTEFFSWNLALRVVTIVVVGWLAQRLIAEPAQRWLQPAKASGQ